MRPLVGWAAGTPPHGNLTHAADSGATTGDGLPPEHGGGRGKVRAFVAPPPALQLTPRTLNVSVMLRRLDARANSLAANADKMMLAELADDVQRAGVSSVHKETAENAVVKRIVVVRVKKGSADRESMLRVLVNFDKVSSRQLETVIKGLFTDENFKEWPPPVSYHIIH